MKTILVTPENDQDFNFLNSLLKKLGYESHILYDEEKEDYALLRAMLQEKKGDYVPESEIKKALGKK
jgi:hypothetical protein